MKWWGSIAQFPWFEMPLCSKNKVEREKDEALVTSYLYCSTCYITGSSLSSVHSVWGGPSWGISRKGECGGLVDLTLSLHMYLPYPLFSLNWGRNGEWRREGGPWGPHIDTISLHMYLPYPLFSLNWGRNGEWRREGGPWGPHIDAILLHMYLLNPLFIQSWLRKDGKGGGGLWGPHIDTVLCHLFMN